MTTPKIYRRKILPIHFHEIVNGYKNFEIRKEDREQFTQFSFLDLFEWENGLYTGNCVRVGIQHVTRNVPGLEPDYAVLGIYVHNIYTMTPEEIENANKKDNP